MARKTGKTTQTDTSPEDTSPATPVEDAVVVSEDAGTAGSDTLVATAADTPNDSVVMDTDTDTVTDGAADTPVAETASDEAPSDEMPTDDSLAGETAADDTVEDTLIADIAGDVSEPDPEPATAITAPPPAVIEKRGPGFLPLVLGGLVAGAIGYAVPTFIAPAPEIDMTRIETLEAELAALGEGGDAEPVDLAPIESAQADLAARLDEVEAQVAALADAPAAGPVDAASTASVENTPVDLAPLRADLDALAARVDASGEAQDVTGALDGLRADLGGRIDAVETGLSDATGRIDGLATRIDEIGAETAAVETEAETLAREAAANQLRIALESGAPFAEPLDVLGDAPDALAASAAEGVATLGDLVADFPPLAREALRAARAGTAPEGVGGMFGSLFNARSLEPREGDDPDAVLSRAEAAVRAGDLDTALAEIDALPESAQDVLADWTARATARRDARVALDDYLQDG
ncbi:hypothetical protein [uncultured Jannaschia sp.]|uniref:COG4223 family protein n=1 Tax=uncultured Jannaschia sp. TaxID=293347 RepID=UPI002627EDA9|nr:hypothetical protein [uncultured Jannaschia sp.]